MNAWLIVAALGIITVALKATGPLLLAHRTPPAWLSRVLVLLPAAVLAALVTVQTLSTGEKLVLDARAVGLAAGASALLLRAPVLIVVVITMATTAAARALLT